MSALSTMTATEYGTPGWPRLVREGEVVGWGEAEDVTAVTSVTPETSVTEADGAAGGLDANPDMDPDDELFLLGERCAEAYAASIA